LYLNHKIRERSIYFSFNLKETTSKLKPVTGRMQHENVRAGEGALNFSNYHFEFSSESFTATPFIFIDS
jgi:hypothetical protein